MGIFVPVEVERYEELLNCEARVEVAVSLLANDKYISVENALRILGATEEADKLKASKNEKSKELSFEELLEE